MNIRIIALLTFTLLSACTGSTVSSVGKHGGNVYALPVEVVDRMLVDAMKAEIPLLMSLIGLLERKSRRRYGRCLKAWLSRLWILL